MLKISNGPKFSASIVLATARNRKVNRAKHSDLTSLLSLCNSMASFNLHFFLAVFLLSSSHKPKTKSSCLLMVSAVWPNKKRYHNPDWILCSKYLGSNLDLDLLGRSVKKGEVSTGEYLGPCLQFYNDRFGVISICGQAKHLSPNWHASICYLVVRLYWPLNCMSLLAPTTCAPLDP